jgi:hypothetical protein
LFFWDTRRWIKSKSTIRSILTHHRQNPTEIRGKMSVTVFKSCSNSFLALNTFNLSYRLVASGCNALHTWQTFTATVELNLSFRGKDRRKSQLAAAKRKLGFWQKKASFVTFPPWTASFHTVISELLKDDIICYMRGLTPFSGYYPPETENQWLDSQSLTSVMYTRAVWNVRGLTLLLQVETFWRCSDGLLFEVPPLASDALLTTLHLLLEDVLQTVFCKLQEDSGTGGFDLGVPCSLLEKPRINRMGRDLDCMAVVLMGFHRSRWARPLLLFNRATLTLHYGNI